MEIRLKKEEIGLFLSLVEQGAGILLAQREWPALDQAVQNGMTRLGMDRPQDYCTYLRSPEGRVEQGRFIARLTNNETYFFREPAHFKVFAEELLPEIVKQSASRRQAIRVLSAGCSRGEEAYSIAIALLESRDRLPRFEFEILGVDIDPRALSAAKQGIFGRNAFRGEGNSGRRDAWFEPLENGKYKLSRDVKEKVRFLHINLHKTPSLKEILGEVDVIFFRNVSIYLSTDAVGRIHGQLADCLREGGYLLVGSAEVRQHNIGRLLMREIGGTFLFQKVGKFTVRRDGKPQRRAISEQPSSPPLRSFASGPASVHEPTDRRSEFIPRQESAPHFKKNIQLETLYREALEDVGDGRKEDALEKLGRVLETDPGHVSACQLMADIYLNNEQFEAAGALCHRALEMDTWLAWPHLFLGLICRQKGDFEAATRALKTAIYIQVDFWPAHFYLGEIYRVQDKGVLAVREYHNVLSGLKKRDREGEQISILMEFSPEYIIRACRENIRNIGESEAGKSTIGSQEGKR